MLAARASRPLRRPALPSLTQSSRRYADAAKEGGSNESNGSKVSQHTTGRTPPGPKDGAYPKILDDAPPAEPSEDVKQHNEDFEHRHDRAQGKINPDGKDNVGKGFWSGTCLDPETRCEREFNVLR